MAGIEQSNGTGIAPFRVNSPSDWKYERSNVSEGLPIHNREAVNDKRIGTGGTYSSVFVRETGIQSIRTMGALAAQPPH